jgi:hypothetical protein
MRNYKNALKHINKEELSTQKVDLSLVEDIEIRSKFIKKTASEAGNLLTDFVFLKKRLKTIENLIESDAKLLNKDIQNAVAKLKELGMEATYVTKFNKTLDIANQEIKKIKSLIS